MARGRASTDITSNVGGHGRRFLGLPRRHWILGLAALGAAGLALQAATKQVDAENLPSPILRTITAQVAPCPIGTGLAFDGTSLLVSCWSTDTIEAVSPTDGKLLATHHISGIRDVGGGIGALGWDRASGLLWACSSSNSVITIDLTTNTYTKRFDTLGCIDGLSFDPSDNTLWVSADASPTLLHYRTDGSVIDTINLGSSLGRCGNSGIAVGGDTLYLANNGCEQIYSQPKLAPGDPATSELMGTYPARLEDLECDDTNFSSGSTVIWSKDAYDSVLNAFDVGLVNCGPSGYRDHDADGIPDEAEVSGLDTDGDGTVDLDLAAMGASPLHKDLFVEIDYYATRPTKFGPFEVGGSNHAPSLDAVQKVVEAYSRMPVSNPDGAQGTTLHLDAGPSSEMNPKTHQLWGAQSRANAIYGAQSPADWANWTELDDLREANVDASRRALFHYAVYGDHLENCSSGCHQGRTTGMSRGIPGHDLVIAAADVSGVQEAVTFAHELGHNLGLGHGGRERQDDPGSRHSNRKANYLSIMNYWYSNTGLVTNIKIGSHYVSGFIGFSPQELDTLETTNLNESRGLNPDPFGHWRVYFRCPNGSAKSADSWGPIDWNCDGSIADGSENRKLQEPIAVARLTLPDRVFGSEDYGHLWFWGYGESYDARNRDIVEFDQTLEEPTIEQMETDGIRWPNPSIIAPQGVQALTVAADSGNFEVPISLTNPLADPVSVVVETVGAPSGTGHAEAPLTVPGRGSAETKLSIPTGELAPGTIVDFSAAISQAGGSQLAGVQFRLTVASAQAVPPNLANCNDAATAATQPGLTETQRASIEHYLQACTPASDPPSQTPEPPAANPPSQTPEPPAANPPSQTPEPLASEKPGQGTPTRVPSSTILTVKPVGKGLTSRSRVTLTAAISPPEASGSVEFFDSGHRLGVSAMRGGRAVLTASGLYGGTQAVTATYSGDGTYAGSSSSPVVLKVRDSARPTVSGPRLSRGPNATLKASFKARDGGGVKSILVKYRTSTRPGKNQLGKWSVSSALAGGKTSWASPSFAAGIKACVAVQARDFAGKASKWRTACAKVR